MPTEPSVGIGSTFIVTGDPSRVTPLTARIGSYFPVGLRIPVLGWTVVRPPSESIYDTVDVVGEYEWAGDFPNRPWNLLADLNSLVAFNYTHSEASLTSPTDIPLKNIVTTTNSTGATDDDLPVAPARNCRWSGNSTSSPAQAHHRRQRCSKPIVDHCPTPGMTP